MKSPVASWESYTLIRSAVTLQAASSLWYTWVWCSNSIWGTEYQWGIAQYGKGLSTLGNPRCNLSTNFQMPNEPSLTMYWVAPTTASWYKHLFKDTCRGKARGPENRWKPAQLLEYPWAFWEDLRRPQPGSSGPWVWVKCQYRILHQTQSWKSTVWNALQSLRMRLDCTYSSEKISKIFPEECTYVDCSHTLGSGGGELLMYLCNIKFLHRIRLAM